MLKNVHLIFKYDEKEFIMAGYRNQFELLVKQDLFRCQNNAEHYTRNYLNTDSKSVEQTQCLHCVYSIDLLFVSTQLIHPCLTHKSGYDKDVFNLYSNAIFQINLVFPSCHKRRTLISTVPNRKVKHRKGRREENEMNLNRQADDRKKSL